MTHEEFKDAVGAFVADVERAVIKKHPEFSDITDPATPEILRWVQTL